MIVTDKFVFVHFPRTGGTFITDVIMKFFPSAREIGYHLPRSLLPKNTPTCRFLGQSAILGNFMFHGIITSGRGMPRTPLISWLTENGKQQFEGATRNALNLGVDNERLDALIEKLPDAGRLPQEKYS